MNTPSSAPQFGTSSNPRLKWRMLKDTFAGRAMAFGGTSVIIAILLIFFYLLYIVFPIFLPAGLTLKSSYALPGVEHGDTLFLAIEEQNEVGARFTETGAVVFFNAQNGDVLLVESPPIPEDATVTSFATSDLADGVVAFGLSNGMALVLKHHYQLSYPNDEKVVTPVIEYPFGQTPLVIDPSGVPLSRLAIRVGEEEHTVVGVNAQGEVRLANLVLEDSLFADEDSYETTNVIVPIANKDIEFLLLEKNQRNLYFANVQGDVTYFDIRDKTSPRLNQQVRITQDGNTLTSLNFLTGDISLLAGDSSGEIQQWFPVRDAQNRYSLQPIRSFESLGSAVVQITPEQRRKGFVALSEKGKTGVFHATAHRTLVSEKITPEAGIFVAISPRANYFLQQDRNDFIHLGHIENEHPEISWSSLWTKVWYENYEKPDYIWQSSSASNDFEPKFSLVPLAFGTLKAAFYAMLFAVPLAIMGAVYTAYFMAPVMRRYVKPTIEIMEALPTVILGFLAGLWLAPFIEKNLMGVFSMLLMLPLGVLLFAYVWSRAPQRIRQWVPDGWQAALLVPVVIVIGWLSITFSYPLERALFGGDMPGWLANTFGIGFDQRNSLVVGMAMGFAVIPTIFSIAEDAIFSVPKHLTYGSLALGATPWQTLVRVVLLTASPGIFSAIMIGMGRAVGETMIVLMATGNTPVMDFSIFQGMRTLSANIAVEMPESEVASSHYRVLFLAALVLFLFTFIFNTVAELVRQRLRKKYSSL